MNIRQVLVFWSAALVAADALAMVPGWADKYIPPFTLSTDPAAFARSKPVNITASFTMPVVAANCATRELILDAYDYSPNQAPVFSRDNAGAKTPSLARVGTSDSIPALGEKGRTHFESLSLKEAAGSKITLVLWHVCQYRIFTGLAGPDGPIYKTVDFATRLGSAYYSFKCSKTVLCRYYPD